MPSARVAIVGIVGSVALFTVLEALAMWAYPGGTWWDPTRVGPSFWQNYLCDFVRASAVDGAPNPIGSRFAIAAMLALTLGLVPVWLTIPRLWIGSNARPDRSRGPNVAGAQAKIVRRLGVVSVAGILAVIFLPSDRYSRVHGVAVVVAGVPALCAIVVTVLGLFAGERRPRVAGWIGVALLASTGLDLVAFVAHLLAGGIGTPLLPVVQRLALLALLAWMLAVAWQLAQTGEHAVHRPSARKRGRDGEGRRGRAGKGD